MKNRELVKIEHRERENCVAIFLRYVENGKRVQRSTGLFYSKEPKTPQERFEKKQAIKEAEAKKSLVVQSLIEGRAVIKQVKQEKVLLTDLIKDYRDNSKAENTRKSYNTLLSKIEIFAPDAEVAMLDKGWFVSFVGWLKGKGLKENSIKLYFAFLNTIMRKAVKDGYIQRNVMDDIDAREKPKTARHKREFLDKEELSRMISYEQHTQVQKEIIRAFVFACYTGLRYSDVKSICWENIRRENGKYYFEIRQQKTKEIVRGGLSAKAFSIIEKNEGEIGNVFCLAGSISYIDKVLRRTAKAVGIDKNVTFHIARHSFAVNLLGGGVGVYTISKLLGHTSIKTTEIYLDIMNNNFDEAVSAIDKML